MSFTKVNNDLKDLEQKIANIITRKNLSTYLRPTENLSTFVSFFKLQIEKAVFNERDLEKFISDNFFINLIDFRNSQIVEFGCPEDTFKLNNFINSEANPLVTTNKVNNLKKLYSNILQPLARYYKKDPNSCILKIKHGLKSLTEITESLKGSTFSDLLTGDACIFTLNGIQDSTVISDIVNKRIGIEYGVLFEYRNGIYISNPISRDDILIQGMYLKSLDNTNKTLVYNLLKE